jgi:hypothetical protein
MYLLNIIIDMRYQIKIIHFLIVKWFQFKIEENENVDVNSYYDLFYKIFHRTLKILRIYKLNWKMKLRFIIQIKIENWNVSPVFTFNWIVIKFIQ